MRSVWGRAFSMVGLISVAVLPLGCGLSPGGWRAQEPIKPPSLRDIAGARRAGPHVLWLPDSLLPPGQRNRARPVPMQRSAVAEIEAANRLVSAWDRRQVYRQLAAERGLDDESQRALVNATLDHLTSETAKEEVLLVLITNPDFSPSTEELILQRLTNFASVTRRQRILAAMPRFRELDRGELDALGWLWDHIR